MRRKTLMAALVCTLSVGLFTTAWAHGPVFHNDSNAGWLGVVLEAGERGGKILEIVPDSPAAAIGLEVGDVIIGIDGRQLPDLGELVRAIRDHEPGDRVELSIERAGNQRNESVTLGENDRKMMRGFDFPVMPFQAFGCSPNKLLLGVHVQQLSGGLMEYFEVDAGVLVSKVQADSAAASAGLKAGDVIIAVDDQPIASHSDLIGVIAEHEAGDRVSLRVVRKGRELRLDAVLAEREQAASGACGFQHELRQLELDPQGPLNEARQAIERARRELEESSFEREQDGADRLELLRRNHPPRQLKLLRHPAFERSLI